MPKTPDFGMMTEEETKAVAVEALMELRLDVRVQTVKEVFSDKTEREELVSWLTDDDEPTKGS